MEYILAHDLGTSGNKATLFSKEGVLIGSVTKAYPVYYDKPLWAEQDANDWWRAICEATKELMASYSIDAASVKAVSFSGQMMGCLPVDKNGNVLTRSIIWADQRAQQQSEKLRDKIDDNHFYQIVGHRNTASYGIQKMMWLQDNAPEIYENTYKFLNAKDYAVYKLTGVFATDCSDANSTGAFNLEKRSWSEEIVEAAGIDWDKLPSIKESTTYIGNVTPKAACETGLSTDTKVVLGAGDGVAANVGAGSVRPGTAYCCMGTSAWVASTTEKPLLDPERRIVCWAHAVPGMYSPNGTMQYAGGSFQWLKNVICEEEASIARELGKSPYDVINERIAAAPAGSNGVLFLPYLMGERAPRWNPDALGTFYGLRATTTRNEILRSVMEGILMNLGICFKILRDSTPISRMLLIGGSASSELWQNAIADIFDVTVDVPRFTQEANSMGAAVIAGVGSGMYEDFSAVDRYIEVLYTREANAENNIVYQECLKKYNALYEALKPVYCM